MANAGSNIYYVLTRSRLIVRRADSVSSTNRLRFICEGTSEDFPWPDVLWWGPAEPGQEESPSELSLRHPKTEPEGHLPAGNPRTPVSEETKLRINGAFRALRAF